MTILILSDLGWHLYLRLFLALVFGVIIGYERATKNKAAGIRTHSLVCLGSALIMILSALDTNQYRDPMRLAAQVVSGIGFIGAGVIWMDKDSIKRGLTTAANIWITSAIGLSLGYGVLDLAVITLVLMFIGIHAPRIFKNLRPYGHHDEDDE
jgi:putative Mg2+ transporter-C (MgtC) family protein